jgi:hypothetical protein
VNRRVIAGLIATIDAEAEMEFSRRAVREPLLVMPGQTRA